MDDLDAPVPLGTDSRLVLQAGCRLQIIWQIGVCVCACACRKARKDRGGWVGVNHRAAHAEDCARAGNRKVGTCQATSGVKVQCRMEARVPHKLSKEAEFVNLGLGFRVGQGKAGQCKKLPQKQNRRLVLGDICYKRSPGGADLV